MSMYPHRGMPQNAARLNELLDQIRSEFDAQVRLNEGYEQQSESLLPPQPRRRGVRRPLWHLLLGQERS